MSEDRVIVEVEDVGDDSELKQEIGVGGVPPRDVEIWEVIREEEKPDKNDDHMTGQTAG